jgi:hypothetical protein
VNLLLAVRWSLIDYRHRCLAAARPEADTAEIGRQATQIRTALRRLRTIRNRSGDIQKTADLIAEETVALRNEIGDALGSIEACLRCAASAPAVKVTRGRRASA